MPRGTKAFNKQKDGDDHKVQPIHQHLTKLGYNVFREPVVTHSNFSTNNRIRRPDLKVQYGKFEVFLEIDGAVHGDFENPSKSTVNRNMDFDKTGMNYIILSEEDCKFHDLDICKLAGYRVGEEYSKFLARG